MRRGPEKPSGHVHLRADELALLPGCVPAHATRRITVAYQQYAYADTRGAGSYQLAYVLHPATMWKEFGPIHLTVRVPKGVRCGASAAIKTTGEQVAAPASVLAEEGANTLVFQVPLDVYEATLTRPEEKRGELFIGLDKAAWEAAFRPVTPPPAPSR